MAKKKYYAVRVGVEPGIYETWDECQAMTKGYSGAIYKSFTDEMEAMEFMEGEVVEAIDWSDLDLSKPYAFVDGSFNSGTGVYGYGGFLVENENRHEVKGSGQDKDMVTMRNVAGEILGARAATELAISLGLETLNICYDYMGIEAWAKGLWKRNKKGTIAYYDYMQSAKEKIDLTFVKVKGHSGVEGNEEADRLAKSAVGIE
jgi:ribonuclease HI